MIITAKKKADINIDDLWGLGQEPIAETDIDSKIKLDEVRKKLDEFKPIQKEIIILRVWQGLTYKEIADIVGKSESNCKMIFMRSVSSLRVDLRLAITFLMIQISLINK